MKTLLHFGFLIWSLQHGGCKHFVHAHKTLLRVWKYQGVMVLRNALINWERHHE